MISILLATYNGMAYLNELLTSLENQTFKGWRLLVIDDNSEDSTVELLNEFKKRTINEVKIFCNQIRVGSPKVNFLKLLQLCEDEYAMFCDQDDIWMPKKIRNSFEEIKKLENCYGKDIPLLVHTDLKVVDEKLEIIDESFYHYQRYKKNGTLNLQLCLNEIPGCTMLLNKKIIELCKCNFDTDKIIMHDSWVALIAYSMGKVEFIDEGLILYRQHNNNSVGAVNANNLIYKIKRALNRTQLKTENKQHILEVLQLLTCYRNQIIDSNILKVLEEYSKLENAGLLLYVYTCIKYNILKYPLSRTVFQLISGC